MELLRQNKSVIRFAKHMLYLKKFQPAKYRLISDLTDGMVLGTWILLSAGFALWLTYEGYTTFDSAMMGICIADLNILGFSCITDPTFSSDFSDEA